MTLSFRNAMRGGLAAAGLMALAVGQNANAATVPTIFGTGVLTNNPTTGAPATFSPAGATDTHYTLTSSTTAPTTSPITTNGSTPFVLNQTTFPASIYAQNPNSQYISPTATGFATPSTFYDYRTTFSLTGFIPSTAAVSGTFSDDDFLYAVYLNGVLTSVHGNTGSGGDLATLTNFGLGSGFVAGLNTIDFVVSNSNFTGGNPSALSVSLAATATVAPPITPEPGSIAMLVGIGVSGAGFLVRRKRRA